MIEQYAHEIVAGFLLGLGLLLFYLGLKENNAD